MSSTEQKIITAFSELLAEKQYSSITVKDIIERCGINRNTFYYHFENIPDLMTRIIKSKIDGIIQQIEPLSSYDAPLDCVKPIAAIALDCRKQILHVYHSVERETFINGFDYLCTYITESYFKSKFKQTTQKIPPDDYKLLVRFYKSILFGILVDWLHSGLKYDIIKEIERLNTIKIGSIYVTQEPQSIRMKGSIWK